MTVEITHLYSTFYILPTIRIWHEKYFDSDNTDKYFEQFCRLSLEVIWFNKSLEFVFIDK